jgi:hypothetical protein
MDMVKFKVAKFLLSSFTQANTLLVNYNLVERGFISPTNAIPLVFVSSKVDGDMARYPILIKKVHNECKGVKPNSIHP